MKKQYLSFFSIVYYFATVHHSQALFNNTMTIYIMRWPQFKYLIDTPYFKSFIDVLIIINLQHKTSEQKYCYYTKIVANLEISI